MFEIKDTFDQLNDLIEKLGGRKLRRGNWGDFEILKLIDLLKDLERKNGKKGFWND